MNDTSQSEEGISAKLATLPTWATAILAILVVVGFLWLFFDVVEPSIAVAIFTAAAAYAATSQHKRLEQQIRIQDDLRKSKTPKYEMFLTHIQRMLLASKGGRPLDEADVKKMLEYHTELMIWGSDRVVRAYAELRSFEPIEGDDEATKHANTVAMLSLYECMFLAVREDLGHEGDKLRDGDLLRMFVTDLPRDFKRLEDHSLE